MCAGDDLIKIGAAAHALKSMSGNIAATRLASACELLEQQASAGESQNVETLCEKIGAEFSLVIDELAIHGQTPELPEQATY